MTEGGTVYFASFLVPQGITLMQNLGFRALRLHVDTEVVKQLCLKFPEVLGVAGSWLFSRCLVE